MKLELDKQELNHLDALSRDLEECLPEEEMKVVVGGHCGEACRSSCSQECYSHCLSTCENIHQGGPIKKPLNPWDI